MYKAESLPGAVKGFQRDHRPFGRRFGGQSPQGEELKLYVEKFGVNFSCGSAYGKYFQ